MIVPEAHLLQDMYPRLVVDYRKDCTGGVRTAQRSLHGRNSTNSTATSFLRLLGVPEGAAVVCFPRSPKPHEVDAEWVRECWR